MERLETAGSNWNSKGSTTNLSAWSWNVLWNCFPAGDQETSSTCCGEAAGKRAGGIIDNFDRLQFLEAGAFAGEGDCAYRGMVTGLLFLESEHLTTFRQWILSYDPTEGSVRPLSVRWGR